MLYNDEYVEDLPEQQDETADLNSEFFSNPKKINPLELNEVSTAETGFTTLEFNPPSVETNFFIEAEMGLFPFYNNNNNSEHKDGENESLANNQMDLETSFSKIGEKSNALTNNTSKPHQEDEKNTFIQQSRKTKSLEAIHKRLWKNEQHSKIRVSFKIKKGEWPRIINQYYDTEKKTLLNADLLSQINPSEKLSTRLKALYSSYNDSTTLVHFKLGDYSLYQFWDALQKSGCKFEVACNYLCIEPRNIRIHAQNELQDYDISLANFLIMIFSKTEEDIKKIPGYDKKLSGDRSDHVMSAVINLVKLILAQDSAKKSVIFLDEDTAVNSNDTSSSCNDSAINNSDENKDYLESEERISYGPSLKVIHEVLSADLDPTSQLEVSRFHLLRIVHQYYDSRSRGILESCDDLRKIKLDDTERLKAIHSEYNNPSLVTTVNFNKYSFYDFWQALQKAKGRIQQTSDYLCLNLPGVRKGAKEAAGNTEAYQEKIANIYSMTEKQVLELLPNAQVKFIDQSCKTTPEAAKALLTMFMAIEDKVKSQTSLIENDNSQKGEDKSLIFASKLENKIQVDFNKIEFDLSGNPSFKIKNNLVVSKGKNPDPNDLTLAMICHNLKLQPKMNMVALIKELNVNRKKLALRIANFRYKGKILSLDLLKKIIQENKPVILYSLHVNSLDSPIASKLGQISDRYSVKVVWFLLKGGNSCDVIKGYVGSLKFEKTIKTIYGIDVDDLRKR